MIIWLKMAMRNLRSGLKGFWIFFTCLALGVAAIAMIGSLASAVSRGLVEQGQVLLGGDLEFALVQREATQEELYWLKSKGDVSHVTTLRAMSQANGSSTLVEIKAIDQAYPLYGKLEPSATQGLRVDPILLQRLKITAGDQLKLGNTAFAIDAAIAIEPDRVAGGIIFGPRVLMTHEQLKATTLVQPGSLVTHGYRLRLNNNATLPTAKALAEEAKAKFPEAGWRIRTTDQAAQGAGDFVERLSTFMTLVSIAALVVGGAGIANAVAAFINRRRETIAILKCLGVPNKDVMATSLVEILLVSLLGIALAMILGAATPYVVKWLFGSVIPLSLSMGFDPLPLLFAACLGLLITVAFSLWPLARITNIKGAALFRAQSFYEDGWPHPKFMGISVALLAIAATITIFMFDERRVTASFLCGLAGSFALLSLLSWLIVKLVSRLPKPKYFLLGQALQSLHRPGSASKSVIMALGLGLTLFVTLALTDQTLSRELRSSLPARAPAFFFVDVQNTQFEQFKSTLQAQTGVTEISNSPMMRGRISKIKGVTADKVKVNGDSSWALRGDRGLTYSEGIPKGSELISGTWWPADYKGPPLVSMTDDIAKDFDLKLGDKITVNVLGRDVDATLASTRKVNWKSMGINFVLVFNPAALKAAPHSEVVTAEMDGGDEGQVLNAMAAAFPSVTSVRVKDVLQTVSDLLGKMLVAVRGANVISLLTGLLVLSGALAAGLSARSYEAVVLKTYGATRGQLLLAFVIEYGLLGLVAAIFGIVVGGIAAWFLAYFIVDMPFHFSFSTAAITALLAMAITILGGLLVTFQALSAKPSFYLRNE